MIKYIIAVGITVLIFLFMGFILHWTRYRKGRGGCCSTPHLAKHEQEKN